MAFQNSRTVVYTILGCIYRQTIPPKHLYPTIQPHEPLIYPNPNPGSLEKIFSQTHHKIRVTSVPQNPLRTGLAHLP